MMRVQKKDGRLEEFDNGKIVNALVSAGLSSQEAGDLAVKVKGYFAAAGKETVASLEIRNKVLELLRVMSPEAVGRFEKYQKPS